MDTLVLVHVVISLIAIVAGLIVMFKMLGSDRVSGLTGIFLLFTILTNVTGFFIPPFLYDKLLPSHMIGILSLILLAIACFAFYSAKLSGMWRWVYVVTALVSLYLNCFVLVIQTFLKVLFTPGWLLERMLGLHRHRPDDRLTIVFSSGSTGEPKGVVLTHRNIGHNADSSIRTIGIERTDRLFAVLPFFHSFGYTVCLWAPLAACATAIYFPDPRAAKEVGELARTHRATLMLATATFLRFYIRRCGAEDFRTIRILICGAEKLPVKLQDEFREKFGVQPLEALDPFLRERLTGLTKQHVGEQAAAHPDLAMDAPHRELDALGIERLFPGQDVLIDAVDQRAVEIEQEGGLEAHRTCGVLYRCVILSENRCPLFGITH